jgi:hypothetical protein
MSGGPTLNCKALASMVLLVLWGIWNKRTMQLFHHMNTLAFTILEKVKRGAKLLVTMVAKRLSKIVPEE